MQTTVDNNDVYSIVLSTQDDVFQARITASGKPVVVNGKEISSKSIKV